MKKRILAVLLVMGLCVGTASARFGFGIVYDPTNYANAVLRYSQLVQQLNQLRQTYTQIVQQYNLAVQMARNLQSIPARYQAQFSRWRNVVAPNTYGHTGTWVNGINTDIPNTVNTGYQLATTPLLQYNGQVLLGMTPDDLNRAKSQYASVELSDGANVTAMAAIGASRDISSSPGRPGVAYLNAVPEERRTRAIVLWTFAWLCLVRNEPMLSFKALANRE